MNIKKPFIIAELSGNHNGDINRALSLVKEAHAAGADAIKLQTYTADTITIDTDKESFSVSEGLWSGYKLYDLYKTASTPWEWHEKLFEYGRELGLVVFSSPFDETAVDFLEGLGCPIYKIASFEITHHPLIKYTASTGKPIIMSTGMASIDEIEEAINIIKESKCSDLTLLHCVSAYPAPVESTNLKTMIDLKERFPFCKIGLSDHSLGTEVSLAAVALGAQVIEKHLTLKRSDGGVDSAFSMEPDEFKNLCEQASIVSNAIGVVDYSRSEGEKKNKLFRRSVFATKKIRKGDTLSRDNIKVVRPSIGLEPKYFEIILGKKSKCNYDLGDPIQSVEV